MRQRGRLAYYQQMEFGTFSGGGIVGHQFLIQERVVFFVNAQLHQVKRGAQHIRPVQLQFPRDGRTCQNQSGNPVIRQGNGAHIAVAKHDIYIR